ncbi:MAG: hypothetical protein NTX25_03175 [Proteobacteria bacterium]|nr:hypothetical protein [Pseudomonadota bacterium]
MVKLFKDPIFIAALATLPAAAIGFSSIIEFKIFIVPILSAFMWSILVFQAYIASKNLESGENNEAGEIEKLQLELQAATERVDRIVDKKIVLIKSNLDKKYAMERTSLEVSIKDLQVENNQLRVQLGERNSDVANTRSTLSELKVEV